MTDKTKIRRGKKSGRRGGCKEEEEEKVVTRNMNAAKIFEEDAEKEI